MRPSLLISTGGGYHLIYLLDKAINVGAFIAQLRMMSNEREIKLSESFANVLLS